MLTDGLLLRREHQRDANHFWQVQHFHSSETADNQRSEICFDEKQVLANYILQLAVCSLVPSRKVTYTPHYVSPSFPDLQLDQQAFNDFVKLFSFLYVSSIYVFG